MLDITIVLYSTLTVPAIYGGAVETLLENFIEENERSQRFKITLIAHKVENVKETAESRHYRYTEFRYISWPTIIIRANSVLINKSQMEFIPDIWDNLLIREIKRAGNRKVIIEGSSRFVLKLKKRLPEKEIYYHLHADIKPFQNKEELKLYNSIKKISVSNYIKDCQIKAGVDASNVFTVVNGIETDRFELERINFTREQICRKFDLDKNKRYILFKGRLVREKGILELIRAFKGLDDRDTVLLICGAKNFGEKRKRLSDYEKKIFDEIKGSSNIITTGHVPYEDIPLLHKIAEICVVPSIWQEPCGLVVIEALVSGVPLVCSTTGGSTQLCENTGAVMIDVNDKYIDSLCDAMKDLLDDDAKRDKISSSEIAKREYFEVKRYFDDMADIIINH